MTPVRRVILVLIILGALAGLLVGASGARWWTLRSMARTEAAAMQRQRAAEDRAREAEVRVLAAESEFATWTARAEVAEEALQSIREARPAIVAEVRRPVAPEVRARRVVDALPQAAEGDVVPEARAGRAGYWLAADRLVVLEEALALRPSLEAEIGALTQSRDAERARAEALTRVTVGLREEVIVWRDAFAAEQGARRREVADALPALPWWAWATGGALAGAAVTAVILR